MCCGSGTGCSLYGRRKGGSCLDGRGVWSIAAGVANLNFIHMKKEVMPENELISREPFPASRKVYVDGKLHPIRVAMREIRVGDTVDGYSSMVTHNAPVTVYDTSGPYTDPAAEIDVHKGLPRLREGWIGARGDWERSKAGQAVTQLYYARKGIVTPEMEYIAIRENQRMDRQGAGAPGRGEGAMRAGG